MSLLPDPRIGLRSAWILMIYYPLHFVLMLVIDQLVGTGGSTRRWGARRMTDVRS